MNENYIEELAVEFANSSPKINKSAPRNVSNPGLYFGYLAGAKKLGDKLDECQRRYRELEAKLKDNT